MNRSSSESEMNETDYRVLQTISMGGDGGVSPSDIAGQTPGIKDSEAARYRLRKIPDEWVGYDAIDEGHTIATRYWYTTSAGEKELENVRLNSTKTARGKDIISRLDDLETAFNRALDRIDDLEEMVDGVGGDDEVPDGMEREWDDYIQEYVLVEIEDDGDSSFDYDWGGADSGWDSGELDG